MTSTIQSSASLARQRFLGEESKDLSSSDDLTTIALSLSAIDSHERDGVIELIRTCEVALSKQLPLPARSESDSPTIRFLKESYLSITENSTSYPTIRGALIRCVLAEGLDDAKYPLATFEACLPKDNRKCGIHALIVILPDGTEVPLRADQICSNLAWRIQYSTPDQNFQRKIDDIVATSLTARIAREIFSINRYHSNLCGPYFAAVQTFERTLRSHVLELLICDILNENEHIAISAPLGDDFFNRADLYLRAQYAGGRARVRVQVFWSSTSSALGMKLKGIKYKKELILISPFSLALIIHGEGPGNLLDLLEVQLRQCETLKKNSCLETALSLRDIFESALTRQSGHPAGPLQNVPEELRSLIRKYAEVFAFRSIAASEKRKKRLYRNEDVAPKLLENEPVKPVVEDESCG